MSQIIYDAVPISSAVSNGGWNDLDMLEIGGNGFRSRNLFPYV